MLRIIFISIILFLGGVFGFSSSLYSQAIIPTACSTSTHTVPSNSSVMFYDDGGPGGDCNVDGAAGNYANANCFTTVTFTGAPGEVLSVVFSVFSMWNTISSFDWMIIYDGPNTSSPILFDNSSGGPDLETGTSCNYDGYSLNFCATSGSLTFRFWATSVVNREGWEAVVSSTSVNVTPTFTQIPPVCQGDSFTLPTTSDNGISGEWFPALNNTTTTTYTFVPDAGGCIPMATMTVEVVPPVTPTFTQIPTICEDDTLLPLPTTSNNGITGTWSPALNNTATTTYTFTPDSPQCATTQTMTITVTPKTIPTFNQIPPICQGEQLPNLPAMSTNAVIGFWSPPEMNNMQTTTYTFTPDAGQCAATQTMTVYVSPGIDADFTADPTLTEVTNTNVEFDNLSSGATSYTWDFGDGSPTNSTEHPNHIFPDEQPGTYTVTLVAYNDDGCSDTAQLQIEIIEILEMSYGIPNIFTPNGDENNEFFKLINPENIIDLNIIILNRWGNVVFESNDVNFVWNGRSMNTGEECTEGVYFYKATLTDAYESKEETGYVHLAR